jgi:hypothetical protein
MAHTDHRRFGVWIASACSPLSNERHQTRGPGGDIKVPLGLPFEPDTERAALALDFLTGPWRFSLTRLSLLRGLHLRATNLDRSWREGAEIRGPGAALMMSACGRTAMLDQLGGPGPTLHDRLSR